MARTSWGWAARARLPDLRWKRGLAVAALASLLTGAPALARAAHAQRSASVAATAFVTTSLLGARLQSDSAAAVAVPRPAVRRLRIEGLGVLDVEAGPADQVRIGSRSGEPATRSAVVVQIAYVSS
jgi:hypothetical protein